MSNPWRFCVTLALFTSMPMTRWLALPLIMLVTMANGPRFGLVAEVVAIASACITEYFILSSNDASSQAFLMSNILLQMLPAFLFGYLYHVTRSFKHTILGGLMMAYIGAAVINAFGVMPNADAIYQAYSCMLEEQFSAPLNSQQLFLVEQLSQFAATYWLAGAYTGLVLMLMLAKRWLHQLYPKTKHERRTTTLHLDRTSAMFLMALATLLLYEPLPQLVTVCAWAGVCLLAINGALLGHWYLREKGVSTSWVLMYYCSLMALPIVMLLMILIGVSDSLVDWRARLAAR